MLNRTLLLLLLAFGAAGAQEPVAEEPVDARRYTVEMIIFSYAEGVSVGTEIFVPDTPPVEEAEALDEFGERLLDRDDSHESSSRSLMSRPSAQSLK